ncbi:MAG TPA: hypothetical protein VIJ50_04825 [Solirubrobacteraceae bacterium]
MTRRMLAAVAVTAALISATALSLPVTSQGATSGCPTPAASAPTKAAIPQELLALKQKAKQYLKLKSIRISFHTELEADTGDLAFNDVSELNLKPREARSILEVEATSPSGKRSSETHKVLEIGNATYRYEPTLTRGDGDRPWVRKSRERSHKESGNSLFEPSPQLLGAATSIVAAGTTTIDGQTVSQFTITYAPDVFPKSELPFGGLLEKECPQPVLVDMAIAASGLPMLVRVSTSYIKSGKTISSSSTTRILAINFHFKTLKRPPARRTIGEAALRRFKAAKLSKELAKHKRRYVAGHKTLYQTCDNS